MTYLENRHVKLAYSSKATEKDFIEVFKDMPEEFFTAVMKCMENKNEEKNN